MKCRTTVAQFSIFELISRENDVDKRRPHASSQLHLRVYIFRPAIFVELQSKHYLLVGLKIKKQIYARQLPMCSVRHEWKRRYCCQLEQHDRRSTSDIDSTYPKDMLSYPARCSCVVSQTRFAPPSGVRTCSQDLDALPFCTIS